MSRTRPVVARRTSTSRRWFGRYGIALGLFGAALLMLPLAPYVEYPLPFNKAIWLERGRRDQDWLHLRGHMAYGLVQSRRLIGLTRAQVFVLLDPPERTQKFSDWGMVYWLGRDRALSLVDSEWLLLRLGADGKVADARLVDD